MSTVRTPHRPKLVYFQYDYGRNAAQFTRLHAQEHIKCLGLSFDVTVVARDCDYAQVCDRFQPHLCVFELGLQQAGARRISIANRQAHAHVPRVGLMNADPWGATAATVVFEADHLQLEAVFSNCTTVAEHLPALADLLFSMPNAIDAQTFSRRPVDKLVPVIMTGACDTQYPWRRAVYGRLSRTPWAAAVFPHHGYGSSVRHQHMLVGREYAQALGSAWFAPTCGTVAMELVRKHLEIPACQTCLVTQPSAALHAAGFVDMVNCVLADGSNVVEKIEYLRSRPAELAAIIEAGHRLVNTRHTFEQRDQIRQWFDLRQRAGAAALRIVQRGPFAALEAVPADSHQATLHLAGRGLHLQAIAEGDALVARGDLLAAQRAYETSLGLVRGLHPARLRLAQCHLLQGRPSTALELLVPLLKESLASGPDATPDPVEWAYFVCCLLCLGRFRSALRRARQFNHVRHPQLDQLRRWLGVAQSDERSRERRSVVATTAPDAWRRRVLEMLINCAQHTVAERIERGEFAAATGTQVAPHSMPATALLSGLDHPAPLHALGRRWRETRTRAMRAARRVASLVRSRAAAGSAGRPGLTLSRADWRRLHRLSPRSVLVLAPGHAPRTADLLSEVSEAVPGALLVCVCDSSPEAAAGDLFRSAAHFVIRRDPNEAHVPAGGESWLARVVQLCGVERFDALVTPTRPYGLDPADRSYLELLLRQAQLVVHVASDTVQTDVGWSGALSTQGNDVH
jgi:hypothetical protein